MALSSVHLTWSPHTLSPHPRSLPIVVPPHLLIDDSTYRAFLDIRVPLTIAIVYAALAHLFNHRSTGSPYAIAKTGAFKVFVVLHNVFLAVYSAWTFAGMVGGMARSVDRTGGLQSLAGSLCRIRQDTRSALNLTSRTMSASDDIEGLGMSVGGGLWEEALAWYGWWFYLSKFYEVLDTAIIVLKGRKSSLLQTYHHSGAMICMWAGIRYMAPPIWIFCVFNSLIHTLMYTYYTLSSIRVRVPSGLKRLLTTLQITQFVVGGSAAVLYLFVNLRDGVPCLSNTGEARAVVINALYLAPLTWLFVAFFVESYTKRGEARCMTKRADKIQ